MACTMIILCVPVCPYNTHGRYYVVVVAVVVIVIVTVIVINIIINIIVIVIIRTYSFLIRAAAIVCK